jgi:hypothetical protein
MMIILMARRALFLSPLIIVPLLAGCDTAGSATPPLRATDAIEPPSESSVIAIPLDADISALTAELERAIPRQLYTINRHIDRCVEPQRVNVLGARIRVTPALGCDVVGRVTRGPIRLHGQGDVIIVDVPINAVISARRVGGTPIRETATGTAMAHARIHLDFDRQWNPRARVDLAYNWTTPPGVDFMGNRISFAEQADEKLRPIVAGLERTLPTVLANADIRRKIDGAWRSAFTTLSLNDRNPPVWMQITPRELRYGGYEIVGRTLRLRLGMTALTRTFIGPRPADPASAPLPPLSRDAGGNALRFFIPVIADYRELQPVLTRALARRSQRPFAVPGVGDVRATFGDVTIYGTDGGRIAVGLNVTARVAGDAGEPTRARVWLTAKPVNAPNSTRVSFAELAVNGRTNGTGSNLALRLANSPGLSTALAESLTQNFERDFGELRGKVDRALVNKQTGDFVINAAINRIDTGQIAAAGQGLYLPVWANGSARVTFRPARR